MITNDELDLIELTLEQGVDDVDQLVNRAITLHAHCVALVGEVRRQRSLLGMGVRIVPRGIVTTSTGTNDDAPRVPVAASEPDASVPDGERLARLTAAFKAHDRDRMECADHDAACDPAGCHDVTVSRYEHEARIALSIIGDAS